VKVKPAPGLKVRFPETGAALPEEGREVPETTYWLRRLRAGDVVIVREEKVDVDPE
jgi:hypothetical protein